MTRLLPVLALLVGCSDQFENELGGPNGSNSGGYNGPQHCWDLDYDGEADPEEDTNGDGRVDVYDCRGEDGSGNNGSDGQDCWDLDGDGVTDPEEDTNGDGVVDVYDCQRGGEGDYFGNVTFYSDAAVTAFCEQYDYVYGSVTLSEGVVDASGLGCLRGVDGVLIATSSTLEILSLPSLDHVTGDLTIGQPSGEGTHCDELAQADFPALSSVGGNLRFSGCNQLTTLELPALTTVGGDLFILGLHGCRSVAAPTLGSLGGRLGIAHADSLSSIDFGGLTDVPGGLSVNSTGALPNLVGLDGIVSIGGSVSMASNAALTSLTGLEGVRTVYSLDISSNDALSSILALHGIEQVESTVNFFANRSLSPSAVDDLVAAIGESNIGDWIQNKWNGSDHP